MFGTDGPTANDSLRPVRSPLMRLLRRARFTTAFVGTIPWLAVITLTVFAALGSGASRADYIALFNGPHTATFAADGSGGLMFSTSGVSQDTVFYTILGGTDFATGGFKLAAVAFAASPLSSGAFRPIAATEGFTYAAPDGDALSGTVLWTSLAVGSEVAGRLSAQLSGELAVDTSVGDTDFLNDFSVGSTADIVAYFLPPCPIDTLAAGGCGVTSEAGSFDGGAVVSAQSVSDVPEPSSLATLGAALGLLLSPRAISCSGNLIPKIARGFRGGPRYFATPPGATRFSRTGRMILYPRTTI